MNKIVLDAIGILHKSKASEALGLLAKANPDATSDELSQALSEGKRTVIPPLRAAA